VRESLVTWCSFQTSNYCVELRKTCEGSEPKVGARGERARAFRLVRKLNYRFGAAFRVPPFLLQGGGLGSLVVLCLYFVVATLRLRGCLWWDRIAAAYRLSTRDQRSQTANETP
jgi:hypothetical protein